MATLLHAFQAESLHQELQRKQSLVALHAFMRQIAEEHPQLVAMFGAPAETLQKEVVERVLHELSLVVMPREPLPAVLHALRRTVSAVPRLFPWERWLPLVSSRLERLRQLEARGSQTADRATV